MENLENGAARRSHEQTLGRTWEDSGFAALLSSLFCKTAQVRLSVKVLLKVLLGTPMVAFWSFSDPKGPRTQRIGFFAIVVMVFGP